MSQCDSIQEKIVDQFDAQFDLNEELRQHLETCQACQSFYQKLLVLKKDFEMEFDEISVDRQSIQKAVIEGTAIREKKESIVGNLLFIIAALVLFSLIGFVVSFGYGSLVIAFQLVIVFISPVIVPVAIYRQMKGVSL